MRARQRRTLEGRNTYGKSEVRLRRAGFDQPLAALEGAQSDDVTQPWPEQTKYAISSNQSKVPSRHGSY